MSKHVDTMVLWHRRGQVFFWLRIVCVLGATLISAFSFSWNQSGESWLQSHNGPMIVSIVISLCVLFSFFYDFYWIFRVWKPASSEAAKLVKSDFKTE